MTKEIKVWIASNYLNLITHRFWTSLDDRYPRGSVHSNWKEAHEAIISARKKEFDKARRQLKNAGINLERAKKMIEPPIGEVAKLKQSKNLDFLENKVK